LILVVDKNLGLISEWERTCGHDARAIIVKWIDLNYLKMISATPSLPGFAARRLLALGFKDTIDKLILRISLVVVNHTIVSDDPDFWDPRNKNNKGNPHAPVAAFCQETLDVNLLLLGQLTKLLQSRFLRNYR
jgi:hypothetical protein